MYVISPTSLQSQILPNVIKTAAQELLEGKYPKTVNELAVNGNDLMQAGLQGKAIGDMQKSLLLKVYANKVMNAKENLLSLAGENKSMIKEDVGDRIEYGALLLFLDIPTWNKITSIINKEDLYNEEGYGIEPDAHVTILYGFHDEVTAEEVFDLYKLNMPLRPIELRVKGINIFESSEYDVVKFDVESDMLKKAHDIMKDLPNTETYPEYHPHITIAYVKKGEGKKYVKSFEKERTLRGNKLVYSTKGQRGDTGENLMLEEGVLTESLADKYAEREFNVNNTNTEQDVQAAGVIQAQEEQPVAYVQGRSERPTAIYKNPKSLKYFGSNTRGIIDPEGNIYVAQRDGNFNHGNLGMALGFMRSESDAMFKHLEKYMLINRVKITNAFGLSDSSADFAEDEFDDNYPIVVGFLRAAKTKNPQYDFYSEYYEKIKGKPIGLNEFAYPEIRPEEKDTWNINGQEVGIPFFVEKYDIWNQGGYTDPSETSVLEFIQNNYEDFTHDEKLKKELLWALTDRNILDETVINEASINSIGNEDILTPEYIKQVEMSDNFERFVEYYQYEYALTDVDREEIENTPDFKNWFKYELMNRYDDAVDRISEKIKPDGNIDIWRRITVDDEESRWINHLADAGKHLGIYWSWDERAAEAHWGNAAHHNDALIKSSIKEEYIDWRNTIYANMDISLGEDEKEITLFKNTLLKIEELYIDDNDVMTSEFASTIKNKTFYA